MKLCPDCGHPLSWGHRCSVADVRRGGSQQLEPLDAEGVLWLAALDRVPIEERIEWVASMMRAVERINAERLRA